LGVMKLPIILLLLVATSAARATECHIYSNLVTLQGVLSRHTFPEQPNYENIAKGDAEATYFFLSPTKKFCVAEGSNTDGLEPAEPRISQVQLVFPDGDVSYKRLRPYLGKKVVCSGSFFHAITGHHHSLVLMDGTKCRSTPHSIGPARKAAQADKFRR
jgi:hypothetical protein